MLFAAQVMKHKNTVYAIKAVKDPIVMNGLFDEIEVFIKYATAHFDFQSVWRM